VFFGKQKCTPLNEERKKIMALYMGQFKYTAEAWIALTNKPEDRRAVLEQQVKKLNGRLLGIYYCIGEYDGVFLMEVPEDLTAEILRLSIIDAKIDKEITLTKLLTVEEAMEAMRKAGSIRYPTPTGR
jgi:uncharacterized protein with GYD domain